MIDKDIGFYNPPSQFSVLFSKEQVDEAVHELAREVKAFYYPTIKPNEQVNFGFTNNQLPTGSVVALVVLKGGYMFGCQFLQYCKLCFDLQFVIAKSYGERMTPQQWVDVTFLDSTDWIKGRNILILDDIADTFHTLKSITNQLYSNGAKDVKTCVLLDKPAGRCEDISPDFYGLRMKSNDFVIGCGLGMGEKFRNLTSIYGVKGQKEMDAAIKEYEENLEWSRKNLSFQQ